MGARAWCLALVGVGFIGGTLSYSTDMPQPITRGGRQVIAADFHVHGWSGDGALSPIAMSFLARHQGIEAFALTNHNRVLAARIARWLSRRMDGPIVLVGEEITAPDFHLIGVGLTKRVPWDQPAEAAIAEVHAQGGVAIAAHPILVSSGYDAEARDLLDGTERMHPLTFRTRAGAEELRVFYDGFADRPRRIAAIGSSDYHWGNLLGMCRTYVFARDRSERAILDAIRAGRTVVFDVDGQAVGDPELLELLRAEPLPPPAGDYDYAGTNAFDSLTRLAGWIGLVGLVGLKRRGGKR